MKYDHNKKFGLSKFQLGYRQFYFNSPKGFSRKIFNVQTDNIPEIKYGNYYAHACQNVKENLNAASKCQVKGT